MEILFLSRWFPDPPDNGAKLRVYHLLRELSTRHTVDLLAFNEGAEDSQASRLRSFCRQVESVLYRPFQPGRARALAGFFSWKPRSVIDTYNGEFARKAGQMVKQHSYDLVIASQVDMLPYAAALAVGRRVAEEIELATLYDRAASPGSAPRRLRGKLTWLKLSAYLRRVLADFEGCTVVSEKEMERLREIVPVRAAVIPNGVDLDWLSGDFGAAQADTLIYNGALTYQANFDAVAYFLAEIFPLIRAARPGVRLLVTGKTEGVPLERLPVTAGVVFTGYLRDVRPVVASAWASVVPLRVGGGTRLKILESMALGTPVVATSKGAEGLRVSPDANILVADSPEAFAGKTLDLLGSAGLRARLATAGRALVEQCYDWKQIGLALNAYLEEVAPAKRERS